MGAISVKGVIGTRGVSVVRGVIGGSLCQFLLSSRLESWDINKGNIKKKYSSNMTKTEFWGYGGLH